MEVTWPLSLKPMMIAISKIVAAPDGSELSVVNKDGISKYKKPKKYFDDFEQEKHSLEFDENSDQKSDKHSELREFAQRTIDDFENDYKAAMAKALTPAIVATVTDHDTTGSDDNPDTIINLSFEVAENEKTRTYPFEIKQGHIKKIARAFTNNTPMDSSLEKVVNDIANDIAKKQVEGEINR